MSNWKPQYTHDEHSKGMREISLIYGAAGIIAGLLAGLLIRGLW